MSLCFVLNEAAGSIKDGELFDTLNSWSFLIRLYHATNFLLSILINCSVSFNLNIFR